MIAILGAGGAIGNELIKLLAARREPFRLVGRTPRNAPGAAEVVAADLTDRSQALRAVAGASLAYLLVGVQYDHRLWADAWPRIMANTIEACKRAGARLIFFDNVYMYGRVTGPTSGKMTEETPFAPCSKKGEIRAKIAASLIDEWQAGALTAMIARSADFYGPNTLNSVPNALVFGPLSRRKKASWLLNDSVPHSYTYTLDAARSLVTLPESDSAWNQTWHVATAPNPPTGNEFIKMAAGEFGVAPRYSVLGRPMLRFAGLFYKTIRDYYEMLYQNDSPYFFDSSKFAHAFGFSGTPYRDGIRATAASFKLRPAS